jgi:hypothetical protein
MVLSLNATNTQAIHAHVTVYVSTINRDPQTFVAGINNRTAPVIASAVHVGYLALWMLMP